MSSSEAPRSPVEAIVRMATKCTFHRSMGALCKRSRIQQTGPSARSRTTPATVSAIATPKRSGSCTFRILGYLDRGTLLGQLVIELLEDRNETQIRPDKPKDASRLGGSPR
jgi:hypothetical protein